MSDAFAIIGVAIVLALHVIPAIIHHRNISRRVKEAKA